MKYMLIMRTTDEALEAAEDIPFEEVIESMGRYNEELVKAGVVVAGEGLAPAEEGCVVDFSGEPPLVTDGPYGETKELFAGFWILDVASKEEAVEWAKRAPLEAGSKIEVRRVPGVEEFPQDNEWIQKEKGWREDLANKS
ncbi:YciI family protein [Nocardia wallacei]|uniref:YciI family protein n=1 Tax=Nocardia wallacei TaxID=480035 RepID=UPI0024589C92|nr:YciI family protein [Nocardia wallacei]